MKVILIILCVTLSAAACQPQSVAVAPTFPPFPTMTPGRVVVGAMPTGAVPPELAALPNPATAIALSNRPTPTPNLAACPVLDGEADLPRRPANIDDARVAILTYLQDGGSINNLREGMRVRWQMLGEDGYVRDDFDLTGEGVNDIVLGWSAPGRQGILMIITCRDGLYVVQHEAQTGTQEPPRLVFIGDMNNQPPAELLVSTQLCASDVCAYETQVLAWDAYSGRFVNRLSTRLNTLEVPVLRDIDSDQVGEIVINMQENGNTATGPLRRGVLIYDWNGSVYTLSIIQLEPPRYYIQIAHEGDERFSQLQMEQAALAYTLLADATDLRYWYNNEAEWLKSYALYRLLLVYAYLGDPRFADVALRLNTELPVGANVSADTIPVYALMGYRFIDSLTLNADLHQACLDVLQVVAERPEALTLLNRYGARSPRYAELDLCPF